MTLATLPPSPVADNAFIDGMLRYAAKVGVERDQLENYFMPQGYFPLKGQLEFHALARRINHDDSVPNKVMCGGNRGGAKSHAIFAQVCLDEMMRFEDLRGVYLRNKGKVAKQQMSELIRKLLKGIRHKWNEREGILEFVDTGSNLIISYFDSPSDLSNFIGLEKDLLVIEEIPLIPGEYVEQIEGSLRSSRFDWRPRAYYAGNPGGVGHQHIVKQFVRPWKKGSETHGRYLNFTYRDNPYIDKDYVAWLESLTGMLARFWRDGDWEAVAGQHFDFDSDRHVCEPFEIAQDAEWWGSLDHGHAHYTVFYLHATVDGMTYTVAEHAAQKWLVEDHAAAINTLLAEFGLNAYELDGIYAGHDCFANRGESDQTTVAARYEKAGIPLTKATINRTQGAAHVQMLLGNPQSGREPQVQIFSTCIGLIATLPLLETDPRRPEDVKKWDTTDEPMGKIQGLDDTITGDDFYDAWRYGLVSVVDAHTPSVDVWLDDYGSETVAGNVTQDADYKQDAGDIVWAIHDGFVGEYQVARGHYTAESQPRVILLVQARDEELAVFGEVHGVNVLGDDHIWIAREKQKALTNSDVVDFALAEGALDLKPRLQAAGIGVFTKAAKPDEALKNMRSMVGLVGGKRRVIVHPRCELLRAEMKKNRINEKTHKPEAAHGSSVAALRYLCWKMRYQYGVG